MKNPKLFQYVIIGIFVLFIILGAIVFSTYRASQNADEAIQISMWGSIPADQFISFTNQYFGNNDLKYTVNYTYKDKSVIDQQLVEAIASGVGPDVIILPQDLIVRYINKIYKIPYTTIPELDFKQTFVQEGEMFMTNEGILALPFLVDPLVMYWNRDIFNNNAITKPPTNWTEFSSLAQKMTKKDSAQNVIKSFAPLGEYRNVRNAKNILSALFMQAGNQIISYNQSDDSFESTLNSGDSTSDVLALQFYTAFSNPTRPEYTWNRSLPNSLEAFTNGDLAVYFGLASEFTYIKAKNPNLNFDLALLPQIKDAKVLSTFGNIWGFAILKNSKNPSGAFTIIKTLTRSDAVPFWADILRIPSARRDVVGAVETNSAKSILNKSAIISKGWYDPQSPVTDSIFQEMVESYTTGRETVDGALNSASDRLDNLLRK